MRAQMDDDPAIKGIRANFKIDAAADVAIAKEAELKRLLEIRDQLLAQLKPGPAPRTPPTRPPEFRSPPSSPQSPSASEPGSY